LIKDFLIIVHTHFPLGRGTKGDGFWISASVGMTGVVLWGRDPSSSFSGRTPQDDRGYCGRAPQNDRRFFWIQALAGMTFSVKEEGHTGKGADYCRFRKVTPRGGMVREIE
jgi:hypothetical protein